LPCSISGHCCKKYQQSTSAHMIKDPGYPHLLHGMVPA